MVVDIPASDVGNCYKAAFDILLKTQGSVLVHGYPRLTDKDSEHFGKKFGHAWIEVEQHGIVLCICNGGLIVPQCLYYQVGKINPKECVRFSLRQALRLANRHEHYGPWRRPPRDAIFARDISDDDS